MLTRDAKTPFVLDELESGLPSATKSKCTRRRRDRRRQNL
jgi:hypothetical protein